MSPPPLISIYCLPLFIDRWRQKYSDNNYLPTVIWIRFPQKKLIGNVHVSVFKLTSENFHENFHAYK